MNDFLLRVVRQAIAEELNGKKSVDIDSLYGIYPELKELGASFVTLNINKRLRGCIGSLVAHRPLLEDLVLNAKSAAFKDPRFNPLTIEEFANVDVEISVLTPATKLMYKGLNDLREKINVGVDGVILKYGDSQATFLPQVWEQLTTFDQFFSSLCNKAGLSPDIMYKNPEIYIYKAHKIK